MKSDRASHRFFLLSITILVVAFPNLPRLVLAVDNVTVAQTPPMGWNSWNFFACDGLNEEVVLKAAHAMVESGLQKAGYEYINLDNCWQEPKRTADGRVVPSRERFPHWTQMIEKIHVLGLRFGLYTDFGLGTCGDKAPGSYGYEEQDAKSYAAWNVDYVKDDDCLPPPGQLSPPSYKKMSEALKATGRDIVFSVKQSQPAATARSVCNLRRVTHDIKDSFYDMVREVNVNHADGLAKYAGPGYWNDMDMLEVGNGNLTLPEEYAHMAFWCLLKSPLILGNDLSHMTRETLAVLANDNAVSINQDPLGVQGTMVTATSSSLDVAIAILTNCSAEPGSHQAWRPEGPAHMMLRNMATGTCLSSQGPAMDNFPSPQQPIVTPCNTSDPSQQWRHDNETNELISAASGLCLTIAKATIPMYQLRMETCKKSAGQQKFSFAGADKEMIQSLFPAYQQHPLCLSVDVVDDLQVWAARLSSGRPGVVVRFAAILFNRAIYAARNVTLKFADLGLAADASLVVQDVWTGAELGHFTGSLTQSVAPHGVSFVVLTGGAH